METGQGDELKRGGYDRSLEVQQKAKKLGAVDTAPAATSRTRRTTQRLSQEECVKSVSCRRDQRRQKRLTRRVRTRLTTIEVTIGKYTVVFLPR